MNRPRQGGWASAVLALFAMLFPPGDPSLQAQENIATNTSSSALRSALQITRTRGVATIAVVTSSDQPSSERFLNEFYNGAWARNNRGLVQVVHLSKDADPGLVRAMSVSRFPTVVVYARGPHGVSQLGTIADCDSAEAVVERLRSLDLGINTPTKADRTVRQTAFVGDTYASQQAQYPPPAACPPVTTPVTPPAPQPQAVTLSLSPQPLATTANVIQVPSQSLMIQQAPPQVFLAPTQAPIVYVPQTLSAAPAHAALGLSAGAAPTAPAGNLFLTSPTLAASPAPQPTLALALGAPTAAPAATLALATGPSGPAAGVSNSTVSLPTAGSRTRVRVRGPGMLGSGLARLGERLTRLGRSRIETVQETTLEAPLNQPLGLGTATISTTSTTPAPQPTTLSLSPPQQQQPPCKTSCPHQPQCEKSCPASPYPPSSSLPSPQKQSW